MSFFVCFSAFRQGREYPFSRELVDNAFREYVVQREPGWMKLTFPDGAQSELTLDEGGVTSGFGVNHPPRNRIFWEIMISLLRSLPAVIYWSGKGCVVADPAMSTQLPPVMVEALGEPIVVTRIEQIWEAMKLV